MTISQGSNGQERRNASRVGLMAKMSLVVLFPGLMLCRPYLWLDCRYPAVQLVDCFLQKPTHATSRAKLNPHLANIGPPTILLGNDEGRTEGCAGLWMLGDA